MVCNFHLMIDHIGSSCLEMTTEAHVYAIDEPNIREYQVDEYPLMIGYV